MMKLAANGRVEADGSISAGAELGLIILQGGQHGLLERFSTGKRGVECSRYLLDLGSELRVAQGRARLGNGPVVCLPPPPSETSTDAGAREVGRSVVNRVPVLPACNDQGPE